MTQTALDLDDGYGRISRCRHGLFLYNRNDLYVGRSLNLYGEYSEAEVRLFASLVGAGDVVVEVGANIGAHTVPLSRLVRPGGAVVAIEPQRLAFQTLCANLALNGVRNVVARRAAAGAAAGWVAVPQADPTVEQNFGGVTLIDCRQGERVALETVDSLELPRCRLLKVDVEGMELEVLRGAADTIARLRPVLYVENDRTDRSPALLGFMRDQGYRLWWHRPALYEADNFLGRAENVFGGVGSFNVLAIPREMGATVTGAEEILDTAAAEPHSE